MKQLQDQIKAIRAKLTQKYHKEGKTELANATDFLRSAEDCLQNEIDKPSITLTPEETKELRENKEITLKQRGSISIGEQTAIEPITMELFHITLTEEDLQKEEIDLGNFKLILR